MITEQSFMWDGGLGKISATEHRIDLKYDIQLVWQNPYMSGHKEREFEREEINKMLNSGVIEPLNSERKSTRVLASSKTGLSDSEPTTGVLTR